MRNGVGDANAAPADARHMRRRVDTSAWRIMGNHHAGFHRLAAPVVFLRATVEDNALFNFAFADEDGQTSYGALSTCVHCRTT